MQVKDLIKVLQELDQDLETCVGDSQYADRPITKAEVKIQDGKLKIGVFPK
ncbi:hypothetical protein QTG56_24530 (plasmid) [Rossellomorea sp. AcN35-11]|nr:hypothetical protein [Rossellomorea aquimaris]WJV31802.1 hypothetical protein QTG56_24530 [Rossellomorea sp. AcN35-11]